MRMRMGAIVSVFNMVSCTSMHHWKRSLFHSIFGSRAEILFSYAIELHSLAAVRCEMCAVIIVHTNHCSLQSFISRFSNSLDTIL